MNRFFLPVIIYFCAIYCFIFFTANQNVWGSTINGNKHPTKSDKSDANKSPQVAKANNAELNKSPETNKKKAAQSVNRNLILVPPPPPEQPSLLDWSNMAGVSESFSLLNEEELKQKLANLQKEIINAQQGLKENTTEVTEAKDKAERFVSLYSEGVVSHKELDMAKKQVSEKERLCQETEGKVQDLKAQENAILRRLASLKKNGKGKQHSNKKKLSNVEKHN